MEVAGPITWLSVLYYLVCLWTSYLYLLAVGFFPLCTMRTSVESLSSITQEESMTLPSWRISQGDGNFPGRRETNEFPFICSAVELLSIHCLSDIDLRAAGIKMSKNWALSPGNSHSCRENNNYHYLFLCARALVMPIRSVLSFNSYKRPLWSCCYLHFRHGAIVSERWSHCSTASLLVHGGTVISIQGLIS